MELRPLTSDVEASGAGVNLKEKLQELCDVLSQPRVDLESVAKILSENPVLSRGSFKEYRGKNLLQIVCSNLAYNIHKPDNILVLEALAVGGANLFYSNKKEDHKEVLHYAATCGKPEILQKIIDLVKKSNAKRINATTSDGETALSLLLKRKNPGKFIDCIKILINAGVDVDLPDENNATPVLLALKKYENYLRQKNREGMASIRAILQLLLDAFCDLDSHRYNQKTARTYLAEYKYRLAVFPSGEPQEKNHLDELFGLLKEGREDEFLQHPELQNYIKHNDGTFTFLQLACKKGLTKSVQALLKMDANPNVKTDKNGLPVEIAGRKGYHDVFAAVLPPTKHLASNLAVEIAKNLHCTPGCRTNHEKCLETLLQEKRVRSCVNTPDEDGCTALHCTTKLRKPASSLCLLKAGARLWAKDRDGNMPVEDIDIGTLENYFNYCIYYKNQRLFNNPWATEEDKKMEKHIEMNYRNLLPLNDPSASHIEVFKKIGEMPELKSVLKHPLVSSYLYFKWHQVRWLYYLNIFVFALYGCFLYAYIFLYYLSGSRPLTIVSVALGFLTFCLILREFAQFFSRWRHYVTELENWLELVLFVMTYVIIAEAPSDLTLRKQVAAFAILLSAHEIVLSLGQLPSCATNVEMLKTVSWNFITFLAWYFVLLLGFALSFYILFSQKEQPSVADGDEPDLFRNLVLSVVKTVVMLTGEFDASSIKFQLYPVTSVLIFLTFVFMISVVVFNLLNGLALTDIQQIRNEAQIVANKSRLRHMQMLESLYTMFYSSRCVTTSHRMKFLRDFFYSRIYSESDFSEQGLVHINKRGRVLNQNPKNTAGGLLSRILGTDRTYLDAETMDKIRVLLDVTKMEDKCLHERKMIQNQVALERRQEKILEEQKEILARLVGFEKQVSTLRELLENNLGGGDAK